MPKSPLSPLSPKVSRVIAVISHNTYTILHTTDISTSTYPIRHSKMPQNTTHFSLTHPPYNPQNRFLPIVSPFVTQTHQFTIISVTQRTTYTLHTQTPYKHHTNTIQTPYNILNNIKNLCQATNQLKERTIPVMDVSSTQTWLSTH